MLVVCLLLCDTAEDVSLQLLIVSIQIQEIITRRCTAVLLHRPSKAQAAGRVTQWWRTWTCLLGSFCVWLEEEDCMLNESSMVSVHKRSCVC